MTSLGVAIPSIPPRSNQLLRAIQSVMAQTHQVDGLSISLDLRKEGAAPTRNRAAQQLNTEWLAFLDDDDELYQNHIEALLRAAEESDADLVYPWFDLKVNGRVNNNSDPLAVPDDTGRLVNPFGQPFTPQLRDYLVTRANFIPVTYIVKRELFLDVGGFPVPGGPEWDHTECEDWGFLIKLARAGANIQHLAQRTWVWHHWGHNTSGRSDRW